MSMKPARPRAFVVLFAVLAASPALAQTAAAPGPAPAPDEEPLPPSLQVPRPGPRPPMTATTADFEPVAPRTAVPDSFLPSLMGPIGLYHLSTAEVGPVNHLRLALHFDYFKSSGFLVSGDENSRLDGSFSFEIGRASCRERV